MTAVLARTAPVQPEVVFREVWRQKNAVCYKTVTRKGAELVTFNADGRTFSQMIGGVCLGHTDECEWPDCPRKHGTGDSDRRVMVMPPADGVSMVVHTIVWSERRLLRMSGPRKPVKPCTAAPSLELVPESNLNLSLNGAVLAQLAAGPAPPPTGAARSSAISATTAK